MMEALAVIPARGGSKGIPQKNILPINGKPLIAYTIENAQRASRIDRVIVSTDDEEISNISKQYGAEVIRRPKGISGDTASSESALLHVLHYIDEFEKQPLPDILMFLQCTSPLTLPEDIDGTINALLDSDSDTALSVTPFHYFLWEKDQDGNAIGINHDKRARLRRQEINLPFLETGAVYAMRIPGFLKAKHRFFGKTAMYIMPNERCLEIDELVDFKIAEVLLRERSIKNY